MKLTPISKAISMPQHALSLYMQYPTLYAINFFSNYEISLKTVLIQISWFYQLIRIALIQISCVLMKPSDRDRHCFSATQ